MTFRKRLTTKQCATLKAHEKDLAEYGLTYQGTSPQMAMNEFMEHAVACGNLKTFETYPMKYNRARPLASTDAARSHLAVDTAAIHAAWPRHHRR